MQCKRDPAFRAHQYRWQSPWAVPAWHSISSLHKGMHKRAPPQGLSTTQLFQPRRSLQAWFLQQLSLNTQNGGKGNWGTVLTEQVMEGSQVPCVPAQHLFHITSLLSVNTRRPRVVALVLFPLNLTPLYVDHDMKPSSHSLAVEECSWSLLVSLLHIPGSQITRQSGQEVLQRAGPTSE